MREGVCDKEWELEVCEAELYTEDGWRYADGSPCRKINNIIWLVMYIHQ